MSIEIISNDQVITDNKTGNPFISKKTNYEKLKEKSEEIPVDTFSNMKISNPAIEKFLYDNADKEDKPKKKTLVCTKCKGSSFLEQDDLRKHFKTNWHNFNAKLSAQSKESLTAEEYDEYILMHPESLK